MTKSLILYSRNLLRIMFNGNLRYLTYDLGRYSGNELFNSPPNYGKKELDKTLLKVIKWLQLSQMKMTDNGFGSYHIASGWGSSYPETTGYIIPTLLNYADKYKDEIAKQWAISAAQFLLNIQLPSGGWQGGRIGENMKEIVFNTGQVIRGLIAIYEAVQEDKYLSAAVKGAEWLCQVQRPDGSWKEHALMNESRVYDAFVDVPLLALYHVTGKEKYRVAALNNLHWILREKMTYNGWFRDCDNTVKHNDKPILHTIAYTLDGLIQSDEYLQDGTFREAARMGADVLRNQSLREGRMYGRYDAHWNGSEYFLCTGAAQMVSVWLSLYRHFKDKSYIEASDKMIGALIQIQRRNFKEKEDTAGAIPGSFPIWGRYEPFAFPNWASKFFADALLLRMEFDE